ncbi:MAG TPA: hypothetical protein VMY34_04925 [Acidimicrobiales bacterium]|nr:hypothetical protein [Acidimicrobiales bacterium]
MTTNKKTPDERIRATAAKQHALIVRAQAVKAGFTKSQIGVRVRRRQWRARGRGVWSIEGAPETFQQEVLVAVLTSPKGAAASHATAAMLLGWESVDRTTRPEVTVKGNQDHTTKLARVHRRKAFDRSDTTLVDGIPCTSVARTIADMASRWSPERVEDVFDDVLCRNRTTPEEIMRQASRLPVGDGGRVVLARLFDAWALSGSPDSAYEVKIARRLLERGIEGLVFQHEVRDDEGTVIAVLDLAIPDEMVGVEFDSFRWHGARRGHKRTNARRNILTALGWSMLAATSGDVEDECLRLAAQVDEVRARRAG